MMRTRVIRGKKCNLTFCNGRSVAKNNILKFGSGSKLDHCTFIIKGKNNEVIVGSNCRLSYVTFWVSGDGNKIILGDGTTVAKHTQFATLEGTKITIGNDCMFSHDILVRTSDSHSIVGSDGVRLNYSKDIEIGNHCWIGLQCLIMKGSCLPNDSVVAARSTLNKCFEESGILVGGAPAKILKSGINWDRKRL